VIETILLFFFLGFVLELIDSSLGGGYGTVLTPLFLIMGYEAIVIVPIILLSETITGFLGGFFHHGFGNVHKKGAGIVAICAVLGSLVGMLFVLRIPSFYLKLYIGCLVAAMGVLVLWKHNKKFKGSYSAKKIGGIGLLCGFNKAISGGGFGPISTAGLTLSGFNPKQAVGTTTMAEGIMSFVGVILYGAIFQINLLIAVPLITGAVLATLPAAHLTHRLPIKKAGGIIGIFIVLLGLLTLAKLFIF